MLLRRLVSRPPSAPVAPSPLPPSPFAFLQENDTLRRGLMALNAIIFTYCAMVSVLLVHTMCHRMPWVSFHCRPELGLTPYGSVLQRLHSMALLLFFFILWTLHRRPRVWVVRMNFVCLAVAGVAMAALGVQQLAVAKQSPSELHSIAAGCLLLVIALTCFTGCYGALCYEKRLVMETRVVVEVIFDQAR